MNRIISSSQFVISKQRESKIIGLAEKIANTTCPLGKVIPETIIRNEGIALIYDSYGDEFDGIIDYIDGGFRIRCNLDRGNLPNSGRGRFTLAHELGHYFIEDHRDKILSSAENSYPSFCENPIGESKFEKEANLFASNLLMPSDRYAVFIRKARKRLSGIVDTAEKFKVSLTCAAIRYVREEIEPSVLVYWAVDTRHWECLSKRFLGADYGALIDNPATLPASSPTQICKAMNAKRSGVIGQKTLGNVWFPHLKEPIAKKLKIREEAVSLGSYGVLTLLTIV